MKTGKGFEVQGSLPALLERAGEIIEGMQFISWITLTPDEEWEGMAPDGEVIRIKIEKK